MIKSRRVRRAGHVVGMGSDEEEEMKKNAYRVLVREAEGKRPPRKPRRRWVYNINMDLGDTGWGSLELIDLAQDMDQWRPLMNMVMKFRVP
jgi:hypothetical protein